MKVEINSVKGTVNLYISHSRREDMSFPLLTLRTEFKNIYTLKT